MKPLLRKVLYVVLWYLVYPQAWYLWLIPGLFTDPAYRLMLAAIVISYVFGVLDTYYRPFSESIKGDLETNLVYNVALLGLFLLNPLFVVAAFRERATVAQLLPLWDSPLVSVAGIALLVVGGAVTVAGRAQLDRFGSGILRIEEGHRLVTTGIYGVIRHPIYGGGIIGVVGVYTAFRSLVTLVVVTAIYFVVIRHRLLFEEGMLVEEFGDEYRNYMKRTKRLIPLIY
ncbi:MAG: isoprenylcysteine carboxylmethyltransferase family protein [Candidatus Bathyarchaeota archaeon]